MKDKMKRIVLLIAFMGLLQISCDKEDKSSLNISSNEIELSAAGTEQRITVQTNEPVWNVMSESSWLVAGRDSCDIVLSAASNPYRSPRTAKLYIACGDRFERVNVTQAGSSRVFGDPYPDAVNPIGIVFKVTDGGAHGTIISLDELPGVWGPTSETHDNVRSFVDGASNTRNLITTHRDDPDFATTYPAFSWVYQMNNGSLDGGWYIPAYYELAEVHNLLTGNVYTIPTGNPPTIHPNITHDLSIRDMFDEALVAHGGTPVDYLARVYWSSSEGTASNALGVRFNNGSATMNMMVSNSKANTIFYTRAILKF